MGTTVAQVLTHRVWWGRDELTRTACGTVTMHFQCSVRVSCYFLGAVGVSLSLVNSFIMFCPGVDLLSFILFEIHLSFLNLWIVVFDQFRKILSHVSSSISSAPFSLLSPATSGSLVLFTLSPVVSPWLSHCLCAVNSLSNLLNLSSSLLISVVSSTLLNLYIEF